MANLVRKRLLYVVEDADFRKGDRRLYMEFVLSNLKLALKLKSNHVIGFRSRGGSQIRLATGYTWKGAILVAYGHDLDPAVYVSYRFTIADPALDWTVHDFRRHALRAGLEIENLDDFPELFKTHDTYEAKHAA